MGLLPIVEGFRRPEAVGLPTRQTFNQQDVNCCLSCALASAIEALDTGVPPLAPLFHFYFAGGQTAIDEGLTLSAARGTLIQKGVCALERHRFPISRPNVGREPDDDAVADGVTRRPIDRATGNLLWKPISSVSPETTWKRHLAAGFPIV